MTNYILSHYICGVNVHPVNQRYGIMYMAPLYVNNIKGDKMKKTITLLMLGFITGILNGLFGSGGGTIIVPALVFLFSIEDHKAHSSAIAIILPLTIISSLIYVKNGIYDIPLTIKVGIGSILGGYIGAKLLNLLSSNSLKKIFGAFMIAAAIRMWFS